jgi:outer membrane protein TolC
MLTHRVSHPLPLLAVLGFALLALGWTGRCHSQPILQGQPEPHPVPPAVLQPPVQAMGLADCLATALQQQPAVEAQRASLAAAQTGARAIDELRFAGLVRHDLPIRKQQACLGVTVAAAGLTQVEYETRYAVTRTYFTYRYALRQRRVVQGLLEKLNANLDKVNLLIKSGNPDVIVTQIDADKLKLTIDLQSPRLVEADQGVQRALAALREAIGLGADCPLLLTDNEDLPGLCGDLDRHVLLSLALQRRGEMIQAGTMARIVDLEAEAQDRLRTQSSAQTFAAGADIHSKPIPQGSNGTEYRPGAVGIEMPTLLVGHRAARVQRARELSGRAQAVVAKTQNLIGLELEDAYIRYEGAAKQVRQLEKAPALARKIYLQTKERFDIGKASGEEIIRGSTLEDQAQAQLNEALFNHALALAALERITAGGFSPVYQPVAATAPAKNP